MAWKAINKNTGQIAGIYTDDEKNAMLLNETYSRRLRFVEIPDGPKAKDAPAEPKEKNTTAPEPVESKKT